MRRTIVCMTATDVAGHAVESADVRRTRRRRGALPNSPRFSNLELESLLEVGAQMLQLSGMIENRPYHHPPFNPETPDEKREREQREAEEDAKFEQKARQLSEKRQQLRAEFAETLNAALAAAYEEGGNMAVRQAERTAWNARSVALYLLVFAVVLMPVIAILAGIIPQDFGSYVAPITGIAGTVVGYWFSRGGGSGSGN